jgi:flagellar basal-body rod modification protein FlgD
MSVSSVSSNSSMISGNSETSSVQQSQDEFLQLLVTQMQNQDPLNPMDNNEFTSQLTQFSQLEQMQFLNSQMEESLIYTQSLNNTMMLGLVGKNATVQGDGVQVNGENISSNKISVDTGGTVTVVVKDDDGNTVRTYEVSSEAGWNDISWDGKDDNGEAVVDGDYSLEIAVSDSAGNDVSFTSYMTGAVESIRFENNLVLLSLAGQEFYASEIVEVGL